VRSRAITWLRTRPGPSGDHPNVAQASHLPFLEILCCPATGQPLSPTGDDHQLTTNDGLHSYALVRGIPIMLSGSTTAISAATYETQPVATRFQGTTSLVTSLMRHLLHAGPTITSNVSTRSNLICLRELLSQRAITHGLQRVLVVGGATEGVGFDALVDSSSITAISTDLAIGPATQVVCDAHHLPFHDGTFDAVVCQAVLEHVADPIRVVAEIHRVLKEDGLLYSEIPFMQQVHEGAHDVTRYTLIGHQRLLRDFEEISAGAQNGPGMALAWSIQYFFQSFTTSRVARSALARLVSLCVFWLKYFDPYLVNRPGGLDAASGTYFLGRRSTVRASDEEIFARYRGAVTNAGLTSRT
jgi:SAM-dependent methyltransferase